MEQVAKVRYQQTEEPGIAEPSFYTKIPIEQCTGLELEVEQVTLQTPHNRVLKCIPRKPVYVKKDTNELVYNSRMMEAEKEYRVDWDGECFMLIKKNDGVEIHRLEEDGD